MGTIRELAGKIKALGLGELYVPLLLFLVGFASFGLGRLSALEEAQPPVRITGPGSSQVTAGKMTEEGSGGGEALAGALVASKNSDKYHYPWCSGAQRIAERNKIWFDSPDEARAAGYEPAANCKGLK